MSPSDPMIAAPPDETPVSGGREARTLRELSPTQWRTGIAAWLGWLFDGLDMHLYMLVAAPFVAQLLGTPDSTDPEVKRNSSLIQAAFLVGWALGGGFFGRIGDRLGRSRALCLTILTYSVFTGLSTFTQTWWQLLIVRFIAALGIGGEWSVGSSILSETWPRRWRPWIAAVLQSGVNIGILFACLTVYLMARVSPHFHRYVFLVGVLPALLVFWIRRAVPEPAEWQAAKAATREKVPGIADLFRGEVRRTTLLTIVLCGLSLSAWWAFLFWNNQHIRNLPDIRGWTVEEKDKLVSSMFFLVMIGAIAGNFFAGWLARLLGYRRSIALCCLGFVVGIVGGYGVERSHQSLIPWVSLIGFSSGVFGLFTMYLPPLFPTLLRATGAGFCYNIGRIVAAAATVIFGLYSIEVGNFRTPMLWSSILFIPAAAVALMMKEPPDEEGGSS